MCIDRDGVLNVDVGSPGVVCVDDLKLEHGAAHAIAILRQAGHRLVCVTNQSAVGKGIIDDAELSHIHANLQEELVRESGSDDARLDAILVATEVGDGGDDTDYDDERQQELRNARRKPGCGMIVEAMQMTGITDVAAVTMIGDRETDMKAAKNAGCSRALVLTTASTSDHMYAAAVDAADASHGRIVVHESLLARGGNRTESEKDGFGEEEMQKHRERVRALLDGAPEEDAVSRGTMEPLRIYGSLLDFALDCLIRDSKAAALSQ